MRRIKELIVVEGRHDQARLERLFDCDILLTSGLALSDDKIEIIRQASEKQGVIVMTDPDFPGKKIRDMIVQKVPNAKHVFIEKKDAIGKRNVGIEYVSDELLTKAIESAVTFTDNTQSISYPEYLKLNLVGDGQKRDYLTEKIKLGKCNNKRLFKYLNMLGYTYKQLGDLLEDYDR